MSQPAIRPWLGAARCSSNVTFKAASCSRIISRYQSTEQHPRLETPSDWTAFRKTRAEASALRMLHYLSDEFKDNELRLF